MKIFISYRRDDSAGYAGRLFDFLRNSFGTKSVFMDIDNIEPGEDFRKVVHNALGTCDIALVIIGKQWLNTLDAQGRRRLDDPEDWVRIEVASALGNPNIRVIPVLVRGATMPGEQDLPEDLRELTWRNALELSDSRFQHDANRLVNVIEPDKKNGIAISISKYKKWVLGLLGIVILLTVLTNYYLTHSQRAPQVPSTTVASLQKSDIPQPVQLSVQNLEQPVPAVVISQMLVSRSDEYYRVEMTIKNPRHQDALLTKVRIYGRPGSVCLSGPATYTISDTINIQSKDGESLQAEGAISEEGSDFKYAIEGFFEVGACGELTFEFLFDTRILLTSEEYTDFYLNIPKNLKTTSEENASVDIDLSRTLERYNEIGVEFWLDDQDRTVAYTLENFPKISDTPTVINAGQPDDHAVAPALIIEPIPLNELVGWTTYQNQNFVTDMAVGADGIIWAGGPEGILRFDPLMNSLAMYTTLDGFPSISITSIEATKDGSVWFGTESEGILRYYDSTWLIYSKNQGLASNLITDISAAPDDTIWISTQDIGVIHFDGSTWQNYNKDSGIPDNNVGKIDVDESGQVWITPDVRVSSNYIVTMFDGISWNIYGWDSNIYEWNSWMQVNEIVAQDDNVWLATNNGAWRLASDGWTRFSRSQGLISDSINDIMVAKDQSIWFASNSGASRFDGENWYAYDTDSGLVSRDVNVITSAPDGSIWFGTNGSGITGLEDQQWTVVATPSCLPLGRLVTRSISTTDDSLWMRLSNSTGYLIDTQKDILVHYEKGNCSRYGLANLAPDDHFLSLYDSKLIANHRGDVWFGTRSGVFQFELGKWIKILDAVYYEDIVVTDDGTLWYSTFDDVKRLDALGWANMGVEHIRTLIDTPAGVLGIDWPTGFGNPVLRIYNFNTQKTDEFPTARIYQSSDGLYDISDQGAVWFSFSGMLYQYHDGRLDDYSVNDDVNSGEITTLAAGPNNTLWVGMETGVRYFDGNDWRSFTTSDGIIDDQIRSIAVDKRGWVWLGTKKGVSFYDGNVWRNFTTRNSGLAGNNILGIIIEPNGESIWFHTTSGFSQYDPSE